MFKVGAEFPGGDHGAPGPPRIRIAVPMISAIRILDILDM